MISRLPALAFLICVASCRGCDNTPPDAQLVSVTGDVSFAPKQDEPQSPVAAPRALYKGNVIQTAAASEALIALQAGELTLKENSVLVVGDARVELGAIVLEGGGEVRAGGKVIRLGTRFGKLTVDVGAVVLVGAGGIAVTVGSVELVDQSGTRKLTPTPASAPASRPVLTVELPILLERSSGRVEVLGPHDRWRRVGKGERLAQGSRVRAVSAGTVRFGDDAKGGALTLEAGATATLTQAQDSDAGATVAYSVEVGRASARIEPHARATHRVVLGKLGKAQPVSLEKGLLRAEAELDAKTPRVTVRAGVVRFADGQEVHAGEARVPGSDVGPLSATEVEVALRPASIVYAGSAPPIALKWPAQKDPVVVEIARDRDFTDVELREQLAGGRLVLDGLSAGRRYWRVKKNGGQWQTGSLTLAKGDAGACTNCRRDNVIDDNGEKTVVYYQQAVPRVVLRWKPIAGAAKYRVKVFADGRFNEAVIDEGASDGDLPLEAGRLGEGTYFWLVAGVDAAGQALAGRPRTNELVIRHDNTVKDLVIDAPEHGSVQPRAEVETRGEVALGARLHVNGREVTPDARGRFRTTVALRRGANTLVYHLVANDGVDRYYVRSVERR
ncbi:MAG: hypothetical protein IT381_27505 [Deltaproteobacteria bacterium]|nr:hypothetical protein [Deltaproteobacteria bacterium]